MSRIGGKSEHGFCSQFLTTTTTTTTSTSGGSKTTPNQDSTSYAWKSESEQNKPLAEPKSILTSINEPQSGDRIVRNDYGIFGPITPPFSPIDIDFLSKTLNSNCPLQCDCCCCCCPLDFKGRFEPTMPETLASTTTTSSTIDPISQIRTFSNGNSSSIPVGIAIARQRSNHEFESQHQQSFLTSPGSSFGSKSPLSTRYFDFTANIFANEPPVKDTTATTFVPGNTPATTWLDANMFSMPLLSPSPSLWQYPVSASATMSSNQMETMLAMPIQLPPPLPPPPPPPPLFPSPFLPLIPSPLSSPTIGGYQLVRDHLTGQFLIVSTATNNVQQQTIYWPNLTQTTTQHQLIVPQLSQSLVPAAAAAAAAAASPFQILSPPEPQSSFIAPNQTFREKLSPASPQPPPPPPNSTNGFVVMSVEAKLAKFESSSNHERNTSAISTPASNEFVEHNNNNHYGNLNDAKATLVTATGTKKTDDVSNLELLSNSIVDFVCSSTKGGGEVVTSSDEKQGEPKAKAEASTLEPPPPPSPQAAEAPAPAAVPSSTQNGALNMLCVLAEEMYQKEVKSDEEATKIDFVSPEFPTVAAVEDDDPKKDECESKLNQKFDRINSNSVRNLSKFLAGSRTPTTTAATTEKSIDFKSCLISLQEKYKRKHEKMAAAAAAVRHRNCDSPGSENGAKRRKIERQQQRRDRERYDRSEQRTSSSASDTSDQSNRKRIRIGPRLKAELKMRPSADKVCAIHDHDLDEKRLRVIYVTENRLCAGTLTPSPLIPLVHEFYSDDKRIAKPEYVARDDVFKSMMKEIRPESKRQLRFGSKICARWSRQKPDFGLATVISLNDDVADAHLRANEVFVQFDEDASHKHVRLEDIRFYNPMISFRNYRSENRPTEKSSSDDAGCVDCGSHDSDDELDECDKSAIPSELGQEHRLKKRTKKKKKSKDRCVSGDGATKPMDVDEDAKSQAGHSSEDQMERRERRRHRRHHHHHHRNRHHHRRHKRIRKSSSDHHDHGYSEAEERPTVEPLAQQPLANVNIYPNPIESSNPITTSYTSTSTKTTLATINDDIPKLLHTRIWRWNSPKFYTRTKPRKNYYRSISNGFEIFQLNDTVVFGTDPTSKLLLGKISKLFEGNFGRKQVACQWFYHPDDLPAHLKAKGRQLRLLHGAVFECHEHTDINDVQSIDWKFELVSYTEFANRTDAARLAVEGRLYYKAGLLTYKRGTEASLEFAADVPLKDY